MVVLTGCGRLAFDPGGGATDAPDAAPDTPNRAFISSSNQPGGFGGTAAADAICANEAASAGLTGTFIAFVGSAAVPDPRARLAGSRGWVLVDGTPVGNTVESMLDAYEVFNPVAMLADGTPLLGSQSTWTGTNQNGFFDATTSCNDWLDSTPAFSGGGNNVRNASWSGGSSVACDSNRRIICFETGHVATVSAVAATGRLAFITVGKRTTALDIPGADAMCNAEATAAVLPGTYRAALTTSTASIESRYAVDARPFIRMDGTFVAPGDVFFTGMNLTSFVHQLSDGSYTRDSYWTGVATTPQATAPANQTCNDWMNMASASSTQGGQSSHTLGAQFWGAFTSACDARLHFLCVQE